MKRFADFIAYLVVRRPWALIVGTLVVLGLSTWIMFTHQRLDSEVLNLLPPQSEGVKALKVYNSEFRQGRELIVALQGTPAQIAGFEEFFLEKLRAETEWVERVAAGAPTQTEANSGGAAEAPAPTLPIGSPEEKRAFQQVMAQLILNADDQTFAKTVSRLSAPSLAQHAERLFNYVAAGSPRAEFERQINPLGLMDLETAMRPFASIFKSEQQQVFSSPDGTLKIFPLVTKQPSLNQADCKQVMVQVEDFKQRLLASWNAMAPVAGETHLPAPQILVTGRTAYVAQIAGSMERDVGLTSALSFFVVTGLFFVGFRRIIPPLGTSLILGCACFVSFAIGVLIFDQLNMIAIAFCSILVGLGDDFSLLLYNRYLMARQQREDHQTAISTSIREVGRGIIYVSITTGLGFLVMLLSGSSGFAQLGTLIAIGIFCCAVFIIVLLFLIIRPSHSHPDRPDPLHGIFDAIAAFLIRRRRGLGIASVVFAVLVFGYALLPIQKLHFDTNPRSLEPKDIPAAVALRAVTSKIPAAAEPINIVLQAPDAQHQYDWWSKVDAHFADLKNQGVLKSYSTPLALMFSPTRLQVHRAKLQQEVNLPASRTAFLQAAKEQGLAEDDLGPELGMFDALQNEVDHPSDVLRTEGLPKSSMLWFLLDRYLAPTPLLAVGYIRPAVPISGYEQQAALEKQLLVPEVPIAITGWSYTMVGLVPWASRELLTFSTAVGLLIFGSMAVAYRAWRPFLVHAMSLFFALALTVALLKATNTPINLLNALSFPLLLGVGVDYGMHLLLALGEPGDPAENLRTVLKPLIISGLTTIAGFGALMFALNPALKGLGTVCALGVTACLVTSVFFGVPILALLGLKRSVPHPEE